jgi:copper transport protein
MKSLSLNIAITLLAWSAVAPAHTHLQKAAPADGSVVTVSPARVVLTFSEAARLTAAWIQKSDGTRVKLGPLPEKPAVEVSIALPALTPGSYVVSWRAASADGHVMPGQIHFTLASSGRNTQTDAGVVPAARTASSSRSISGTKSEVRAPGAVAIRASSS